MKPSRRDVLKAATLAVAGTLLPPPIFALESGAGQGSGPETSRSAWVDRLGSTFVIRHGKSGRRPSVPIEVRLLSVADVSSAEAAGVVGHEGAFSLLFEGPRWPVLKQGTYELSDFGSSPLTLFLVPVDRALTEQHYEAVFNNPFN